jgi:hypothetical protein
MWDARCQMNQTHACSRAGWHFTSPSHNSLFFPPFGLQLPLERQAENSCFPRWNANS